MYPTPTHAARLHKIGLPTGGVLRAQPCGRPYNADAFHADEFHAAGLPMRMDGRDDITAGRVTYTNWSLRGVYSLRVRLRPTWYGGPTGDAYPSGGIVHPARGSDVSDPYPCGAFT